MSIEIDLGGQPALVTGAGAGIGRAIVRRLAQAGAAVVVTDKHEGRMLETVAEIDAEVPGATVVGHRLDIERRDDFDRVFAAVEAALGPIGIFVWNASLNIPQPVFEYDAELFDRITMANVNNCWYASVGVVEQMKRRGGGVLTFIGSMAPEAGAAANEPPYAMSKAAQRALMNGIAKAGGPFGIRCNDVSMGVVAGTRFVDTRPELAAQFEPQLPLGRMSDTDDIADAVLFLCSDHARYVTGTTLNVTGGLYTTL